MIKKSSIVASGTIRWSKKRRPEAVTSGLPHPFSKTNLISYLQGFSPRRTKPDPKKMDFIENYRKVNLHQRLLIPPYMGASSIAVGGAYSDRR